jgi:hypothetical protein
MARSAARRDNGIRDTSCQRTAWPRLEERTSLGVEMRSSPSASKKRLPRWRSGITMRSSGAKRRTSFGRSGAPVRSPDSAEVANQSWKEMCSEDPGCRAVGRPFAQFRIEETGDWPGNILALKAVPDMSENLAVDVRPIDNVANPVASAVSGQSHRPHQTSPASP